MISIGIDVGTTTISITAIDAKTGETIQSITENSEAFIDSPKTFQKIQSVEKIEAIVQKNVQEFVRKFPSIASIGVTGQMHGIVYLNKDGNPVSPLYTWQDQSAAEKKQSGKTYIEEIFEKTQVKIAAGYGLATHYYNAQNGLVPKEAVTLCTIHDYISMKLCGNTLPLMHASDAASLGFFDSEKGAFETEKLEKLHISADFLPPVTKTCVLNGTYQNIPVSVAIGDNQASFIGSVDDDSALLINIGTGSQISVVGDPKIPFPSGEARPLYDEKSILVGSALCGGRAYACLEKFFREIFVAYDGNNEKTYELMNRLAEAGYQESNPLKISTKFSGTRQDSTIRGSIENISTENLTPQSLTFGILKGCVDELYEMYEEIAYKLSEKPAKLIASGNGMRKSALWRKIASETFRMELFVPRHAEEAAYGAALFALAAAKVYPNINEARKIIQYL